MCVCVCVCVDSQAQLFRGAELQLLDDRLELTNHVCVGFFVVGGFVFDGFENANGSTQGWESASGFISIGIDIDMGMGMGMGSGLNGSGCPMQAARLTPLAIATPATSDHHPLKPRS